MVKKIVKTHSRIRNTLWYLSSKVGTVSRKTIKTLARIENNKKTSNSFPAGVSASKMIS
jgi:hypothetical protein